MSGQQERTRYTASQLVEAIGRARGDSRYFLVAALTVFPGPERDDALTRVLDTDLAPDERHWVLGALARLRPSRYLRELIIEGLHSRSINVQQMVVAELPSLLGDGRDSEFADELERWLRRRLKSPGRKNTWAVWEVPGIALSLLPSRAPGRVWKLLEETSSRMQPEERERWRTVQEAGDDEARIDALREWFQENLDDEDDLEADLDPTALVYVDRVMKRLGFRPANPESATYDDLQDEEALPELSVDLRLGSDLDK
jgi:hypothetical protein